MPAKVKPGFIYGIRSNANGKIYIGQTKDINKRIMNHRSDLSKNKHPNKPLQEDFNRYGYDNFTLEKIEKVKDGNREILRKRETFWIQKNKDNCYNIQKRRRRTTISISKNLKNRIKINAKINGMTISNYLDKTIENIYE